MLPVRQRCWPNERANCLQAALASLLELPLDRVIDVTDPQYVENWWEALEGWALTEGVELTAVGPEEVPVGYAIAVGEVRRSTEPHAIVVLDGVPVWDPNPSDQMIDEVHGYIVAARQSLEAA